MNAKAPAQAGAFDFYGGVYVTHFATGLLKMRLEKSRSGPISVFSYQVGGLFGQPTRIDCRPELEQVRPSPPVAKTTTLPELRTAFGA